MSGDVKGFADLALAQSAINDAALGGRNAGQFRQGTLTTAFEEIEE